ELGASFGSNSSLAIHAREDQVQFFGFTIKGAGGFSQPRFSSGNQAKKVFRFLRLFYAPSDGVPEVLLRNALVRFAIVRSHARSAADELADQPIIARTARNPFRELHNRFTKTRRPLLQVEWMPARPIAVAIRRLHHPRHALV